MVSLSASVWEGSSPSVSSGLGVNWFQGTAVLFACPALLLTSERACLLPPLLLASLLSFFSLSAWTEGQWLCGHPQPFSAGLGPPEHLGLFAVQVATAELSSPHHGKTI